MWWFFALQESGLLEGKAVRGELSVGSGLEGGGEFFEAVLEDGLGCCREEGTEG